MTTQDESAQHFLDLIKQSSRGKLKIYVGMSAGVGKTYRMLLEAHALKKNGVDIRIGYIEAHNRAETIALIEGLPFIERKKVMYKGKEIEEMDLDAIIKAHPEVVIVDELAHSNIDGCKNSKRWQDVLDLLDAGINVISAVNIQHIESLNAEIQKITGVVVQEKIPDKVLGFANEVVNIDLTADELITRLKEGKIYDSAKIEMALKNFFKPEHILQLRELALKEVATQVERKIETELPKNKGLRVERFLACVSSNNETGKLIIRKTARLAAYYNSEWFLLYVQTKSENVDNIELSTQRHLINQFKLATELGGEVIRVQSDNIAKAIIDTAIEKKVSTICIGKPHFNIFKVILNTNTFNQLLQKLSALDIDIVILS